jgi:uncharacterized RDD family membrane protein YckC
MDAELKYAGFWRRFGAFWLDALILLPLSFLTLWFDGRYRLFQLYYVVPGFIIAVLYSVYLVKQYGGTPGKIIAGLRIVKVDGSPIGYREAILRFLPEFLLAEATSLALILATLQVGDSEYTSLGFMKRSVLLVSLAPAWYKPVQYLQTVWVWSEFIVLLTNKKRRAIHDFIAGTVVIVRNSNQLTDPTLPPVLPSVTVGPGL